VPADFADSPGCPFQARFRSLRPLLLSYPLASKLWSPQAPKFRSLRISRLLADLSNGWMASLPGRRKSPTRG